MLPDAEERAISNLTQVRYSAGGQYGFNRVSLLAVVRSNCLERVGEVACGSRKAEWPGRVAIEPEAKPCRRGPMHTMEDATVGLCMHLTRARLIECDCFRNAKMLPPETWPPHHVVTHVRARERELAQRHGIRPRLDVRGAPVLMRGAETELASLFLGVRLHLGTGHALGGAGHRNETRHPTARAGYAGASRKRPAHQQQQAGAQQLGSGITSHNTSKTVKLCRDPITLHPLKCAHMRSYPICECTPSHIFPALCLRSASKNTWYSKAAHTTHFASCGSPISGGNHL